MFINDLFENDDDMFAGSQRVQQQIQRDRHPLKDYLEFEDYDHLMDEFDDAQSAVKNNAELDAYLESFESGLKSAAIPQVIVDIVEEFVHGRHGKYGTEVPRRNEALLTDLNTAFSQIWMDYKPDRFVRTLTRHMANACVAAIHAEDEYDGFNESADVDDMFAPSKFQKWTNAVKKVLDELYEFEADNYNRQSDERVLIKIGELMSDYDFLRSELARSGLKGFLNGLDSVGQDVIDAFDSVLAIKQRVHLSDIEKAFYPENFNESEDDMFAPSKLERIASSLDKLADIFTQYQHSQQSVHYCRNLAKIFRTQGIDRGVWAWRQTRPDNNSQFANGGISRTAQIYVQKETGFNIADRYLDLDPKQMRGEYDLDESEDDMFAVSDRTSKIPAAIIVGDREFLLQDKIKQHIINYAKAHNLKIFGSVPDAWRLEIYFRGSVDGIYPLVLELEDMAGDDWIVTLLSGKWDIKANKPFLGESEEDDMFAPDPAQRFKQSLQQYAKEKQAEWDNSHPSWRDSDNYRSAQDRIATILDLADECIGTMGFMRVLMKLARIIEHSRNNAWVYEFDDWCYDHKYPRLTDLFQKYDDKLSEDVDDMFSTASRNWISFDELFADQLDLDEDRRDDIAGWLYDFETDVAIDLINELVGGNVTVTDAYFDDDKADWYFKYK